jgi:hypothetical protein
MPVTKVSFSHSDYLRMHNCSSVWRVKGLHDWTLVTRPPLHLHVLHLHLSHQFLLDLFLYLFRIN